MSELKVDKVSPRTGNYVALNTVGSKNIIINGDMSIAQRGTSVASISSGFTYDTVDRYLTSIGTAGTWTQSQSTDVPTGQGFSKSLKMDCTTANASLSAGSSLRISQLFEGQMLQYLKKGTANAESLTLSFWVKSNKTGTYIVEIDDNDNSRNINKSYTINSANTWEKKTITFAGDTTGTLDNDNGHSLNVSFWLVAGTTFSSGTLQTSWGSTVNADRAVGQVNLADNTANEWYITGVQLEAGTSASDFEFLPVDVNLNRCLRYYQEPNFVFIYNMGILNKYIVDCLNFPVEMRAQPTMSATFATIGATVGDELVAPRGTKGFYFYSNFSGGASSTARNQASNITADAEL